MQVFMVGIEQARNLAAAVLVAATATSAAAQSPAPAVLVAPAQMKALSRQTELVGRVEAVEKVDLRARATGFLSARSFKEGDAVKSGQVLFEIEPEPFQAAVDQRQAQVAGAQAALENARLQLERGRELGRTNAIAQAQIDQRVADEARASASVKEAQAALEDAKIKLSYTQIRSPIDGRVGRAPISVGNLVGPDAGVLATVVRDDEVRVLFSVTQRDVLEVRSRNNVASLVPRLRLADGRIYDKQGKLDFIDVTADSKTDGQIVRSTFPNPDHILTDGQTVRIVIEQEGGQQAVAIPQAAIAVDQTGQYVFVVNASNQAEQRRIKIGAQRDGLFAVEDGVRAGDLVVVQGLQRLRNGLTVTPQRVPN